MAEELQAEGDDMFIGFASRLDPANLKPGMLQASFNARLQRGIAQPRKGTKRLTDNDLALLTMVGSGLYVDDEGRDNIVLVFTNEMYLYRPAQGADPEFLSDPYSFPFPRTIAVGGICDVVTALNKIYIFRGKYDKTTFAASASNPSIAAGGTGTITITTVGNHGYSNNDEVTIGRTVGSDGPGQAVTNSYVITVTGPTTFTFQYTNYTGSTYAARSGESGWTARRGKPPLIWDGQGTLLSAPQKFMVDGTTVTGITESVPCADFGLYFQNRLVLKYGDYQVLVSDILSEQCDTTLNNFIINTGGNDSIVGVLPWVQDQFLVFMTKSVYVVYVDTNNFDIGSPPGAQSSTTVVTTEIGCLARRSIVAAGQFVFFLSANGVHMLTPQLDLKLLGNTLPLSEPIADFFDTVNYNAVQNSVATYFNNRFYIAMPTGSATRNDKILVYNTLNQAWESIDYYPTGLFQDNFILSAYINQRRLMIITNFAGGDQYGGVFLSEEQIEGDEFNTSVVTPVLPFNLFPASLQPNGEPVKTESTIATTQNFIHIPASIKTREYAFGGTSEKRFSRGEFTFNNVQNDFVRIDTTTYDPDATETVLEYSFSGNSDGTLRPRIAARGTSIACTVNFVVGRPSLKSAAVYAIAANRPMISQE
jgi:predicted RNA-binding protein with TRAM domain